MVAGARDIAKDFPCTWEQGERSNLRGLAYETKLGPSPVYPASSCTQYRTGLENVMSVIRSPDLQPQRLRGLYWIVVLPARFERACVQLPFQLLRRKSGYESMSWFSYRFDSQDNCCWSHSFL